VKVAHVDGVVVGQGVVVGLRVVVGQGVVVSLRVVVGQGVVVNVRQHWGGVQPPGPHMIKFS